MVSVAPRFSNYTFLSPQKREVLALSSLLARVLLTQKVTAAEEFGIWEFIPRVVATLRQI